MVVLGGVAVSYERVTPVHCNGRLEGMLQQIPDIFLRQFPSLLVHGKILGVYTCFVRFRKWTPIPDPQS